MNHLEFFLFFTKFDTSKNQMPPKKKGKGGDKGAKNELQMVKDEEARKKALEEAKEKAKVDLYNLRFYEFIRIRKSN